MNKSSDMQVLIAAEKIRSLIAITGKLLGEEYQADLEPMFNNLLYEGLPASAHSADLAQLKKAYGELKEKEFNFLYFIEDMLSVLEDKEFLKIFTESDSEIINLLVKELKDFHKQHQLLISTLGECENQEEMISNIKDAYEQYFNVKSYIKLAAMFPQLDILMNDPKYASHIDQHAQIRIDEINKANRIYNLSFSSISNMGLKSGTIYVQKGRKDKVNITLLNSEGKKVSFRMDVSMKNVKENEEAFRGFIISEAVKKVNARNEITLTSNSNRMLVRLRDKPKKMTSQFSTQYTLRRGMLVDAFCKHTEKTEINRSKLAPIVLALNKTSTVSNRAAAGTIDQLKKLEEKNQIFNSIQCKIENDPIKESILNIFKELQAVVDLDTLPPDVLSEKTVDFEQIIEAMKKSIKDSLSKLALYLMEQGIHFLGKDCLDLVVKIDNCNFDQLVDCIVKIIDKTIEVNAIEKEASQSEEHVDSKEEACLDENINSEAEENKILPLAVRPEPVIEFSKPDAVEENISSHSSSEEGIFISTESYLDLSISSSSSDSGSYSFSESTHEVSRDSGLPDPISKSVSVSQARVPSSRSRPSSAVMFNKEEERDDLTGKAPSPPAVPVSVVVPGDKLSRPSPQGVTSTFSFFKQASPDNIQKLRNDLFKQEGLFSSKSINVSNAIKLCESGDFNGFYNLAWAALTGREKGRGGQGVPKDPVAAYYLTCLAEITMPKNNLRAQEVMKKLTEKVKSAHKMRDCHDKFPKINGLNPKELYFSYALKELEHALLVR